MRTHLDGAVYSAAATANGSMMLLCVLSDIRKWRPEPESNRRARICSPLRHHSAIGPLNNNLPNQQCRHVVKAGT